MIIAGVCVGVCVMAWALGGLEIDSRGNETLGGR